MFQHLIAAENLMNQAESRGWQHDQQQWVEIDAGDFNFDGVIDGCARSVDNRPKTWINARIRRLYRRLFARGHCHTVAAWQDGQSARGASENFCNASSS